MQVHPDVGPKSSHCTGIANISGEREFAGEHPRVPRPGLQALIRTESWEPHAIFPFLQHHGGIAMDEMYKT